MEEQSDTPRTEMAEGQRLNPYFEGRFDGESDELCALRLTLARERDEARAEVERLRKATEERDEWRLASEPPEDGRRVLIWVAKSGGETFRPAYCPAGGWTSVFDGETLVAWRDVTPPTEGAR